MGGFPALRYVRAGVLILMQKNAYHIFHVLHPREVLTLASVAYGMQNSLYTSPDGNILTEIVTVLNLNKPKKDLSDLQRLWG
jgi:hypothetical protein